MNSKEAGMKCSWIMTLLMTLLSCLSCELRTNHAESASRPEKVSVSLKPTEAIIREMKDSIAIEKETRIGQTLDRGDRWQKAQFVTEQGGWASTLTSVYRTSDGGSTWERLSFRALNHSRISSVHFIDELQGWLVTTKQDDSERYGLGNSSKIFSTKDGGDTWIERADFPDEVRIKEIKFLNASQGFATGARVIDQPINHGPPYEEPLVLSSTDGGNVWRDVSGGIKNVIRSESGAISDSGLSLHSPSATEILVLTSNGRIVRTFDQGGSWKTIAKFESEPSNGIASSTAFYKLVVDAEQRVRVLGGAMGDEGYWGNLVMKGDNNSWTSYELIRTPILDAVFISKDEVLACGFETPPPDKRNASTVGIVLHSLDGGQTWTPIYRSKSNEAFISVTKVGDDSVYAISDAGTFLRLAFKK
jgi:photosystem II stability/assembly factor-like uncharacterized protein